MIMPMRIARGLAGASLWLGLLLLPQWGFTQPPASGDVSKQIAELEKQIAELQKKLEALRQQQQAGQPVVTVNDVIQKLTWRCIGPANMGGRITAIAVVESDPSTYYVATASGGLIKTTNNGTTFTHLFDRENTVSIGDVAVAPSNPNIVWVGTGEANPRNSVSYGDGVYKSTDGGKTWTNMGLKQTFQIGKILIHPKNPDIVYVGALGRLYGPNAERGLFKTTDGGKTWNKILYVDDKTGVIDMVMDPFDPETLIVAMWERRRDEFDGFYGPNTSWPTTDQYGPVVTHGPGSGLYKTTDGGKSWKKLNDPAKPNGLPTVKLGRIGLDVSRKTKGLVYAIIDTENVGKGRPPITAYMGISSDTAPGGGVKIEEVGDGPVAKAGGKNGDVIVALDGKKIADYDAMLEYISTKKPGDKVQFTVLRDKKELQYTVTLGRRPDAPPPALGITVGRGPAGGGVTIDSVTPDGPAAKAGLQPGDVITQIAGKNVSDQKSLRAVLLEFAPGDKVNLAYTRGNESKKVEVVLAPPVVSARPFLLSQSVGGQQPNVQRDQGKDGYQTGGVFVSRDGGETWSRVNSLNPRPFYFSVIRIDPNDDKTIYVLGDTSLWRSTNGGERFSAAPARGVHPDHHALWINPKDSRHMLIGTDGGFYVTYDRGENWDHLNVLALGQFYHVCVDNRTPYNVYGGLQDNGSWGGPSQTLRSTGPSNEDWIFLNGGDGFTCRVDLSDPDIVYATSQNGGMLRRNLRTGETTRISARPVNPGEPLRWNWNTPFILSHHNPAIFYCGAQYVFRSVNRGADLKVISPDLTASKKGTISALAESPRNADLLWAGTDDGNLWISRDGGQKWTNLTDKLRSAGLPGPRWISSIEPSRFVEGRCYVAIDAHRSDDDKPYLFVTEDYGQTWKPLHAGLPPFGSTRVLREDITNPNILYCGTEFAVFVSFDRGARWFKLNSNLPTVAIHEVAQPTTANEIVVATHGRSVWVLDVTTLRQLAPPATGAASTGLKAFQEPATLFAPPTVIRWKLETGRASPYSREVRKFSGENPTRGVVFDYLLTKPAKSISLKVTDVTGNTVREFRNLSAEAGFHRVSWNLSASGGTGRTGRVAGLGVAIPAGTYRVVLTVDGKELSQPLLVENDPKADPKAIISFDTPNPDWEEDEDETARSEQQERRHQDEDDDTTSQQAGLWGISWTIAA
ncbi:MAG: PDZ domain-containing protein [Gemmataceae bacterium]|nr:PDZ domain-containing protein [Gemmataceae bacterium]